MASVGPYAFHSRAPARQRLARPGLSRSPPTSQFSTSGTVCPSSRLSSEGTPLATRTPERRIISASAPGSVRSSLDAIASVPPPPRVTATSSTAASKLNDTN